MKKKFIKINEEYVDIYSIERISDIQTDLYISKKKFIELYLSSDSTVKIYYWLKREDSEDLAKHILENIRQTILADLIESNTVIKEYNNNF